VRERGKKEIEHESHHAFARLGIIDEQSSVGGEVTADPLVLPDIKDMLKKKEIQRELEQLEEERKVDVKKIKRSDKVAFNKVRHCY
jgi:hypothetical protein